MDLILLQLPPHLTCLFQKKCNKPEKTAIDDPELQT